MIKDRLREKFIEAASRIAGGPLQYAPDWLSALGAGSLLSFVVEGRPTLKEKLSELEGRTFEFKATDLNKSIHMRVKDRHIETLPHAERAPDVIMTGETKVLLELLLGSSDPDTVFFSRKLRISGDTAAAILLKNILADV